jgi:hypothetical protein
MPISDFLSGLFGKRKPTLEQLSLDDLRRDQIKAENELDTLLKENEKSQTMSRSIKRSTQPLVRPAEIHLRVLLLKNCKTCK